MLGLVKRETKGKPKVPSKITSVNLGCHGLTTWPGLNFLASTEVFQPGLPRKQVEQVFCFWILEEPGRLGWWQLSVEAEVPQ